MAKLKLIKLFEGKQVSFFPIYMMDLAATSSVGRLLNVISGLVLNVYNKTDVVMYTDGSAWINVCDAARNKLIKSQTFYKEIQVGMRERCDGLKDFSDGLQKLKPTILSNGELTEIFRSFERITVDLRAYAWIPNFFDMGSKSIFEIAEEKLKKQIGPDLKIKEYISKLTTPVEQTQQRKHELDLFKIQLNILKSHNKNWKKDEHINQLIDEHVKKYGWLAYYYIGPAWTRGDIVELLENNLKLIKNPSEKIREINNYARVITNEKKQLLKKLKLKKDTSLLLEKIGAMIFLKAYRKEFLIYSNYCFEPILVEIGRRLNLPLAAIRYLTGDEIEKYLADKNLLNEKARKEIAERYLRGCVSVAEKGEIKMLPLAGGNKYLKFVAKEINDDSDEIKGSPTYPGKIAGLAKIINLKEEVGKIKEGEILVSRSTNPDLIIAMQKAAAFVTNEGGITCHAAIVSREMKKPCIVGTKIATKLIHDGDLIEVDAGKGIVNILKKAK